MKKIKLLYTDRLYSDWFEVWYDGRSIFTGHPEDFEWDFWLNELGIVEIQNEVKK